MLKKNILEKLVNHKPHLLDKTPINAAVMMIILTDEKNNHLLQIVLTKRAATLFAYAGDFSFPGGIYEINDKDLFATATREVNEELGLSKNSYQLIAQLDDFIDRLGHRVRPFVTLMDKTEFIKQLRMAKDEVEQIYYFSFDQLANIQDDPNLYSMTKRRPSYAFHDGDVYVWGLTATILVHVFNIITKQNKPLGKKPSPQ